MNRLALSTFRSDTTPCQMLPSASRTFWFRLSSHTSPAMAATQTTVTSHPAALKRWKTASKLVPVSSKNVVNIRNWLATVSNAMPRTNSVSMARSVTTVPSAFGNETPSFCRNTPQRRNSPLRGTTSEAAYDRNTAWILTDALDRSPNGSNDCRQRRPRSISAMMPKGSDKSIHVHDISLLSTSRTRSKSKSRYIQYRIAPPSTSDTATFKIFLPFFLTFNGRLSVSSYKITKINQNTKRF